MIKMNKDGVNIDTIIFEKLQEAEREELQEKQRYSSKDILHDMEAIIKEYVETQVRP